MSVIYVWSKGKKIRKNTIESGDDRVEDEGFVVHQLVASEGRHGLEEESGGAGKVPDGHLVQRLVGAKTVLALPITALNDNDKMIKSISNTQ